MDNYIKLYKIQDKVFNVISDHETPLYLTGGTALGRYYLNHRFSDDIYLFVNADDLFNKYVTQIRQILEKNFSISTDGMIVTDSFIRIWVEDGEFKLKIEFVNDVNARWGECLRINGILIDTPGNILANKLTAIISRDEPKDVYDIITLSLKYSFNWDEVFTQSLRKAICSEQDVVWRLKSFPVELFESQRWLFEPVNLNAMKVNLDAITDDFLFARDNSLGKGKIHISEAIPHLNTL